MNGFSVSGLARAAGLDATSFNKSKRATPNGKPRWPTTESIAKCLDATRTSLDDFAGLLHGMQLPRRRIPRISIDRAGESGLFDDAGHPSSDQWDDVQLLEVNDKNAYALKITGNAIMPAYRDGDTIIVSPGSTPRPRDRVVVKTASDEILIGLLRFVSDTEFELAPLNPLQAKQSFEHSDIKWMARIIWSSQ